jgi:hypothetical protein
MSGKWARTSAQFAARPVSGTEVDEEIEGLDTRVEG